MADKFLNRYIVGAVCWAIFILVLTLTPGKSVPDVSLFDYDKLGHAGVFFVLSALMSKGIFEAKETNKMKAVLITLVTVSLYGLMIEIAQDFIPDRGMEWFDALANVIGSFLGVLMFYILNLRKA